MRATKANTILDINQPTLDRHQVTKLIERMTNGSMNNPRFRHFVHMVTLKMLAYATREQWVSLLKLHDIGWVITKIVWQSNNEKVALAISMPDGAAWLLPNGKLERPAVNRTTVVLPAGWSTAETAE